MGHIIKLIYLLLRGLVYDNKDEFDFKSTKFNSRKFIVLIAIFLSIILNIVLFLRFWSIVEKYESCQETVEKLQPSPSPPVIKKPE